MNDTRTLKVGDVIYVPSEVIGLHTRSFPGGFKQEQVIHAPVGSGHYDGQYISPRDRVWRMTMSEFAALGKLEERKRMHAENAIPAHPYGDSSYGSNDPALGGDSALSFDDNPELAAALKSTQKTEEEAATCGPLSAPATPPQLVEVSQDEEDYLKDNGNLFLLCDGVIRELSPITERKVFFARGKEYSDKGMSVGRFHFIAKTKDGDLVAYIKA